MLDYFLLLNMVLWYNIFLSHTGYDDILLFLIYLYTSVVIVIYFLLYWLWHVFSKYVKLNNNWNDKYLYIYILRFIPFWLFIGCFISWLKKQKKALIHIILSNIIFLWFAYSLYFSYSHFIIKFVNENIWWWPASQMFFINNLAEVLPAVITLLTLFLIGISWFISFYLWKRK